MSTSTTSVQQTTLILKELLKQISGCFFPEGGVNCMLRSDDLQQQIKDFVIKFLSNHHISSDHDLVLCKIDGILIAFWNLLGGRCQDVFPVIFQILKRLIPPESERVGVQKLANLVASAIMSSTVHEQRCQRILEELIRLSDAGYVLCLQECPYLVFQGLRQHGGLIIERGCDINKPAAEDSCTVVAAPETLFPNFKSGVVSIPTGCTNKFQSTHMCFPFLQAENRTIVSVHLYWAFTANLKKLQSFASHQIAAASMVAQAVLQELPEADTNLFLAGDWNITHSCVASSLLPLDSRIKKVGFKKSATGQVINPTASIDAVYKLDIGAAL